MSHFNLVHLLLGKETIFKRSVLFFRLSWVGTKTVSKKKGYCRKVPTSGNRKMGKKNNKVVKGKQENTSFFLKRQANQNPKPWTIHHLKKLLGNRNKHTGQRNAERHPRWKAPKAKTRLRVGAQVKLKSCARQSSALARPRAAAQPWINAGHDVPH